MGVNGGRNDFNVRLDVGRGREGCTGAIEAFRATGWTAAASATPDVGEAFLTHGSGDDVGSVTASGGRIGGGGAGDAALWLEEGSQHELCSFLGGKAFCT